jgi:signal transduction histidine kinase
MSMTECMIPGTIHQEATAVEETRQDQVLHSVSSQARLQPLGKAQAMPRDEMGKAERMTTASPNKPQRPYVLPLAVSLVSLVMVVLLITMGGINYRALRRNLVGLIVNDALAIADHFERTADFKHRLVTYRPDGHGRGSRRSHPIQRHFIYRLVELCREPARQAVSDPQQVAEFLEQESIQLLALLDDSGAPRYQSQPIPAEIARQIEPALTGRHGFFENILDWDREPTAPIVVADREESSGETIIIIMDDDGLQLQQLRFAVQEALDDMVQLPDFIYLTAVDEQGRDLGAIGEPLSGSDLHVRELQIASELKEHTVRKISDQEHLIMEVESLLNVGQGPGITVRIGLESGAAFRLVSKSNRTVLMATIFMVVFTLLSMGMLYRAQKRHMVSLRSMERRISQATRLSALGRLASGVAHEIRNPLNAISIAVQRLQREHPHSLVDVLRDEIVRLNQIVEEFFSFAGTRKMVLRPTDLVELLKPLVLLCEEEGATRDIEVRCEWPSEAILVAADADKIKQALLNLLKNALESIEESGTVEVTVSSDNRWVSVAITDSGSGMDEERRARVFELDFTTKDKGLGLGLPLAYEIVQTHGGTIEVTSRPGEGSCFTVRLPRAETAANGE